MAGIVFLIFGIGLIIGLPIVTGIGIATFWPKLMGAAGSTSNEAVIRAIFGGADSTPIIAVPLFILAGVLMARGGISKKIFNVVAYFIGNKTGGMPSAAVLTCLFYGAISGSGPATAAAVGGMTLPLLIELGYNKVFCAALIATAGSLGVIIPPSIPFVLYGTATSTSVGNLFIAGILPGILIGLVLIFYTYFYCKKNGEDKEKIQRNYDEIRSLGILKLLKDSFWALLSPLIILGGIYSGYFTPTEAACISVFYSLVISLFIYKTIELNNIWGMVISSVRGYAPLIFILSIATAFGRVLALLRAPQMISEMFANTFTSAVPFLFIIVVFFFILGMVMDTGPAIVIMAPILVPTLEAFNIDLVHFGVIMVCCLAIGLVTPPFGLNLFVTAPLIETPVLEVGRKTIPLIAVYTVALLLITFVPAISLILL
ncbi:MAG: TRAP transporter large permease [Gudongella sp.]|nr:TRAP transporter large permease [Gudongella sp.]